MLYKKAIRRITLPLIAALVLTASLILFHNSKTESLSAHMAGQGFNPEWSAVNWAQRSQFERAELNKDWVDRVEKKVWSVGKPFVETADGFVLGHPSSGIDYLVTNSGFKAFGTDWDATISPSVITDGNYSLSASKGTGLKKANDFELVQHYDGFDIQYLSTAEGLRQNFVLHGWKGETGSITVHQEVLSELEAETNANELILRENGRAVFHYHDLVIWDSNGKRLDGSMKLQSDGQLALNVNTFDAEWPITIDPVSTSYDWKFTGGVDFASLGTWIAGNGDLNGDGFDDVVLGAPSYSLDSMAQGAIFIFYGSSAGLPELPNKVIYGEQEEGQLGKCVSIEGDVNGDGYDDLLVGAHQISNFKKFEGKAYLYYGGPDGIGDEYAWSFEGNRKGAKLGEALTMAGDLNGDGFEDVVIGAHGWDNLEEMGDDGNKAGKFLVFHGNAEGLSEVPAMECVADVTDANLGISIDKAGDVNGDGYDDIHVGGYIFLIGDGMICTFHGGPGGADNTPDFMAIGGAEDTSFYAVNLSNAGDVNGDGYDDVVIGAPRFDSHGIYQSGKLHLHYGGPAGIDTNIAWVASGTQYDERFAFNVNDAGDLNNDGYDDVLVTSKYFIDPVLADSVGKALLYLGGPNGPAQYPQWEFLGETTNGGGTNTCLAGDVNGDGQEDILVSGDSYTGDNLKEGAVYGFYGEPYNCGRPGSLNAVALSPTKAHLEWERLPGATKYEVKVSEFSTAGSYFEVISYGNGVLVSGLSPGQSYRLNFRGFCEAGPSDWSKSFIIHMPTFRYADLSEMEDPAFYPNPVRDNLTIDFGTDQGEASLQVFDMSGNQVFNGRFSLEGNRQLTFNQVQQFANGVYLFRLEVNGMVTTRQITVSR